MKFLIYKGSNKDQAEKLKKILEFLYDQSEVRITSSKVSTAGVTRYSKDNDCIFNITSRSDVYKSYSDRVLNVNLDSNAGSLLYEIVNFVDVGVTEKTVVGALKLF